MKAMQCEMCCSNDLVKQDGIYVCQSCGTKYSVEEARKLIIEGSVDVSGSTVKVDNSDLVEKHLVNARRAVQRKDWEDTEKYYDLIIQNDPDNFEAIFYCSYGKAMQSLSDSDLTKRRSAFKSLHSCFSILYDNYSIDQDNQVTILKGMTQDLLDMFGSSFKYNQTKNGYGNVVSDDKKQTTALFEWICSGFAATLKSIGIKYKSDTKSVIIFKLAVVMYECSMNSFGVLYCTVEESLLACHNEIKKIDKLHIIPDYKKKLNKSMITGTIFLVILGVIFLTLGIILEGDFAKLFCILMTVYCLGYALYRIILQIANSILNK